MFRRALVACLLMLFFPAGAVLALGLGDIHLSSGLNQPLSADIDLIGASREELSRLTVSLASRETFLQFGVDRPSFLSTVKFRVVEDGAGHAVLRARSTDVFTEPFVDLLITLDWPGGKLIRDYTLLLDLPGTQVAAAPLPASAHTRAEAPVQHTSGDAPASPARAPQAQPQAIRAGATADAQPYTVVAGDTLESIVREHGAHSGRARARLMRSIIALNPQSFADGTHSVEAGSTLLLPARGHPPATRSTHTQARTAAHGEPTAPATAAVRSPAPAKAAAPIDATALTALTQRVDALEKALGQANDALLREHALVLSLREDLTEATARTAASPYVSPAPAPAPVSAPSTATYAQDAARSAAPAADVAAPAEQAANDESEPALPVYVASRAAAGAPPGAEETVAPPRPRSHAAWFLLVVPLVLMGWWAARALLRRRAERAALAEFDADDPFDEETWTAEHPPDEVHAADDADAHGTAVETAHGDAVAPADALAHLDPAVPMPHYDVDTSYLSALEVDLNSGEYSTAHAPPSAESTDVYDALQDVGADDTVVRRPDDVPVGADMAILEPNFTSRDMELTSRRYDHQTGTEHRSNGTDALRDALLAAIEREPDRVDLRVKLLEVYYASTIANNLAFYELASALSRERTSLPSEEQARIAAMQRAIATAPSRQIADEDDTLVADCA